MENSYPKIDKAYNAEINKMRTEYLQLRNDDPDFARNWDNNDKDFNEWLGSHFDIDDIVNDILSKSSIIFKDYKKYIINKWNNNIEKLIN
jgi:hypothetical protein